MMRFLHAGPWLSPEFKPTVQLNAGMDTSATQLV